ncbi:TIGR03013 family PEP-CTERM/XrtA system glycosyltransferase [Geminicoccaceae bacterium 1502E]|nr:TIGR03013 family PEP-CTERM/XrtA system glycosyltransferase [Geminicoccaceae bacterium 1502E]
MLRIFGHYVERSLVAFGLAEGALLLLCFYAGYFASYAELDAAMAQVRAYLPNALLFVVATLGSMIALGLYDRAAVRDLRVVAIRLAASFLLGFVALTTVVYLYPPLLVWRSGLVVSLPLSFLAILAARGGFLWMIDRPRLRRRVLVLGDEERVAHIRTIEESGALSSFATAGVLRLDQLAGGEDDGAWLRDMARELGAEEIVVGAAERRGRLPVEALLECRLAGLRVTDYTDFCERETGRVDLDRLKPSWLIFSDGFGRAGLPGLVKRLFDVALSLAVLLLTAPLLGLTALAVKLQDGGPVLYRQQRTGRNGVVFELMKFRSMRADAEAAGPQFAQERDPRITPVGRLIRRLRIDELPQLWNVLRGEMSFVGPRPERPVFVEQLARRLPYYRERHRAKPGITGWAQLNHRYTSDLEEARTKLEYDIYYVKNWSMFLDILILAQTLRVVIWGNGVR